MNAKTEPVSERQKLAPILRHPDAIHCGRDIAGDLLAAEQREWLVTNGLGGYASASVSGACTRRYHGLLVSAFPAPLGRMVMLSHLSEEIALSNKSRVRLLARENLSAPKTARPGVRALSWSKWWTATTGGGSYGL